MGSLRAILAIAVVLTHSETSFFGYTPMSGDVAVQCFYIVSGFFMAMVLAEKYTGPGSAYLFYSNRALRIFAPYFAALVVAFVFHGALYAFTGRGIFATYADAWGRADPFSLAFVGLTNLTLFGQDWTLFLGFDQGGDLQFVRDFTASDPRVSNLLLIPPAWSLGLELTFYALAPFLLRLRTGWLVFVLALTLIGRGIAYYLGFAGDPWSYRFFPFELGTFLLGALAYRLGPRLLPLAFLPLAAVLLFPWFDDGAKAFFSPPKIGLYLIVAAFLPALFRVTKTNRLDQTLGDLSYPIYLCHMLVIAGLAEVVPIEAPTLRAFVIVGLSILMAWLIVRAIDRPLDRYRQARARQSSLPRRSSQPSGATRHVVDGTDARTVI